MAAQAHTTRNPPVHMQAVPQTLGVLPGYIAQQPTTLVMREKFMSWTGDDYSIKTTEGVPVLRVRGTVMSMTGRTEVCNNNGEHLFTVRKELFSILKNYYAEDPSGSKFLTCDGEWSFLKPKSSIHFLNASDGQQIELKMKGDWLDMATEIKYNNTVVARIDREMRTGWQILGGPQTYFVTVAPNVDIAMMVAACICFAIIETSSPAPSPSAAQQGQSTNIDTSALPSPARPTSRRSNVTRQIFQFALGYPQTPPETSPVSDPAESALETELLEKEEIMGSFLFQWSHPASEVYVTGTFDDWAKSVKLDGKAGGLHEKLVELPKADEKIYYKFVVDGTWTTDHTAPQETDSANNTNNVLLPENIIRKSHASTGTLGAGAMASSNLPGSFPETPAAEHTGFRGVDSSSEMSPATDKGAEDSEQAFGVSPLPATSGIGNPVQTQPGEKVPEPSSFTNNTINSAVTTDKESYEKSGSSYQLPEVVTPQKDRDARGAGMFGLPETSRNMIPESSLPMGGPAAAEKDPGYTIQSSGPQSTTAELAGQVPFETRAVPEMVTESQDKAGFAPEASASNEMVAEKSAMEQELESKVPEEPATSEGTNTANGGPSAANGNTTDKKALSGGEIAGMVGGGAGITATAAAVSGYMSHGAASEGTTSMPTRGLPPSVQQSIDQMNKGPSGVSTSAGTAIDPKVPDLVQKSIADEHWSPEAASSPEMVQEKSAMEAELLKKVPTENMGGIPAPSSSAAMLPISTMKSTESGVPHVVEESMAQSFSPPEAAAEPEMVQEKSAMEKELLKKVPTENMGGEPAPSSSAALTESAPAPTMKSTETPLKESNQKATEAPLTESMPTSNISGPGLAASAAAPATTSVAAPSAMSQALKTPEADSRDVSPMTRGPGTASQTQPMVTTGVGSSSTAPVSTPSKPAAPATSKPSTSNPMSSKNAESVASGSSEAKKRNRASGFFGKLKSKFSDKDKK